jgi:putative flippase GtrA
MKPAELIKKHKEPIAQFVKFNLVGIINTGVDFVIFTLLTLTSLHHLIAQVISYSCGMVNSYLWNKFWTFKHKKKSGGGEAVKFIVVNIIALGIALVFLYIFKDLMGMHVLVSKVFATGFSVVVNFVGNKFWVFK